MQYVRALIDRLSFLDPRGTRLRWIRRHPGAWLSGWRPLTAKLPQFDLIERLADRTNAIGPQTLWKGYVDASRGPRRRPAEVRTRRRTGQFFAALVAARKPELIVEIGTAFGVSGMYWLAGLHASGGGRLHTFEPNEEWARVARENLREIGDRFCLTVGTFEDQISQLGEGQVIDIAFIDAIHRCDVVLRQLRFLLPKCRPGALILFDDINFSTDMRVCWKEIAADPRFSASAQLDRRVGIVELHR